jgi:hypothetical protein
LTLALIHPDHWSGLWTFASARYPIGSEAILMARWPRNARTTIFTYLAVFLLFPILCWLAYAWVQGWLF